MDMLDLKFRIGESHFLSIEDWGLWNIVSAEYVITVHIYNEFDPTSFFCVCEDNLRSRNIHYRGSL